MITPHQQAVLRILSLQDDVALGADFTTIKSGLQRMGFVRGNGATIRATLRSMEGKGLIVYDMETRRWYLSSPVLVDNLNAGLAPGPAAKAKKASSLQAQRDRCLAALDNVSTVLADLNATLESSGIVGLTGKDASAYLRAVNDAYFELQRAVDLVTVKAQVTGLGVHPIHAV